jgi:DNA-binding response OmpR family regulator
MDYDTRRLKVMVVENDRTILELIELRLHVAGFDPCMARTGRSAIEMVSNFRPAAIVLDLSLPDMDGLEVLQAANPRPECNTIPTLVIAKHFAEADLQRAIRLGARDCLTKPFSGADVLARVARMLKRSPPPPPRRPAAPQSVVHL